MKKSEPLVKAFLQDHPESAARAIESVDAAVAAEMLGQFPPSVTGPVLERLTPVSAGAVMDKFSADQVRALLGAMETKHSVIVLRHLQEEKREAALAGLPENERARIRKLLQAPADSAAGMMEPAVFSFAIDLTVQKAIASLRRAPRSNLHYLYVTDRDGRLAGVIGMRDLLLASPQDPIEPLVQRGVVAVPEMMKREEVAGIMRQKRYLALPVVDTDGRLLGVVRHDQALAAMQVAGFEDLQKMVGAGGDEQAMSPVSVVVRKRLPWLVVNLATAFLASAVISMFEGVLEKIVALAVLMPIVAGQGGNTGAQTLAVVIRGLALREVLPGLGWRLILKETLGGLLNGLAVAAITGLCVWAWYGKPGLAAVIGISMIVNMTAAGVSGAAIPLALHAMGRDPAQSSSIFMTTVTDIVGFASFLGCAMLMMRWL